MNLNYENDISLLTDLVQPKEILEQKITDLYTKPDPQNKPQKSFDFTNKTYNKYIYYVIII